MALADDLLAQAATLATVDIGIPSQANLRRSISSAYYAMFHMLIADAVVLLVPPQPAGLRARASRSFSHGEMKQVCSRFLAKRFGVDLAPLLGQNISLALFFVAEAFGDLQEERHSADYDVGRSYSRSDALSAVNQARVGFFNWNRIRSTDEANVFLTALAFGVRWAK
jgi:hypothetical protein